MKFLNSGRLIKVIRVIFIVLVRKFRGILDLFGKY